MTKSCVRIFLIFSLLSTLSCGKAEDPKKEIRGPFVYGPFKARVQHVDLRSTPEKYMAPRWEPGDPLIVRNEMEALGQVGSRRAGGFRDWLCDLCRRLGLCGEPEEEIPEPVDETPEADEKIVLDDSWDGIPSTGILPPDPVGDIGPEHYVQAVNWAFEVFDRSGNSLTNGPLQLGTLWNNPDLPCGCLKNGDKAECIEPPFDPVVRYDALADRWLISYVITWKNFDEKYQCIAVSKTGDPVNTDWYLNEIPDEDPGTGDSIVLDFTKIGVWSGSYFMSNFAGLSRVDAWALDRDALLNDGNLQMVRFEVADDDIVLLPADADGQLPAAGTPGLFARQVDAEREGMSGVDRVEIYSLDVDWADPFSATLEQVASLPTEPFDSVLCQADDGCVPQPDTPQRLETKSPWPSWRLQFRKAHLHETLLFNHTVNANGSGLAGIRWYEIRRPPGGNWAIFQQGTHFDETTNRFLGSISMDNLGNIAVGYAVSGESVYPGIRIAGRRPTDTLGTMPLAELHVIDGGGYQQTNSDYGDYSTMDVDPVDGCTFWYTQEYYDVTSAGGWKTRIASVRLPGCEPAD